MGEAPDLRRAHDLSGRAAFVLVAALVLALALFTAVVRPAVERGGVAELLVVIAAVAVVLGVERWLRTR